MNTERCAHKYMQHEEIAMNIQGDVVRRDPAWCPDCRWVAISVKILRQHVEFTAAADCPHCGCVNIHPFEYTVTWTTGEEAEIMCGTTDRWVRRCCTKCGYKWLQR